MPGGKKNKRKSGQDVLTTRLMQISFKMDDHIYCNNLISTAAAEEYLREIASLKTKYPRANSRVLQVIEKLTRCMKGIITEDKVHAEYVPVSPVQAYTEIGEASSPIYSLPDEDRTEHLSQVNLTNDSIDDQITDLAEDDYKIAQEPENIIEKVKIAISKMGLQNEPEILLSDDNCSQSILENFQNDNTRCNEINRQTDNLQLHVNNNQPGKEMNEVGKTAINLPIVLEEDCSQSVLDIFYNENKKYSEKRQERELEIYQYITKNNPVTRPAVANEIKNTYTMNHTLEIQQSKCNIEALNFDINKEAPAKVPAQASKTENKKRRRKKNKEDNVTVKRKSQSKVKNTAKTCNKHKPIQRGRKPPSNIVLGKPVARSNISVDKPETIYNENVECDLSWVENLRYVREISQEENDPTLSILDDNFWNNFNLPDKWNDQDFGM
ncbi:hypothetical protein MSG28_003145 [Choristoneura fumiferana]|uniref:Uncharacterized protein n=1 Tax=Choristoneura fumiferana TaxID=7141 RepID=A0ACC0KDU8_CHOFU|nr:hypothetical protein MSG28_003145 [Choristoneura fumiferana]